MMRKFVGVEAVSIAAKWTTANWVMEEGGAGYTHVPVSRSVAEPRSA